MSLKRLFLTFDFPLPLLPLEKRVVVVGGGGSWLILRFFTQRG